MQPFVRVDGVIAPLLQDNIDSDQILPSAYLRGLDPDFAAGFFGLWRKDPTFVLNQPAYQHPKVLLAGQNFGCGSTREQAVWAIAAFGIRVLIARSFAEVFRANCLKNGLLPIVLDEAEHARLATTVAAAHGSAPFNIDLETQRITGPGNLLLEFKLATFERLALLEGLDEIGLTLREFDAITAYEARDRERRPWLQNFTKPV